MSDDYIPVEEEWVEKIEVRGSELRETINKLVHQATARYIVVKNSEGERLIEIPLLIGIGGLVMLPYIAAIGVIGALVADCKITVIRKA